MTATYSLLPNGKVRVLNSGNGSSFEGKLRTARGTARIADTATNAKPKVSFLWPFAGDHWILELGKDYEYVVVGERSRRYLWILSRTPHMDGAVYDGILKRVRDLDSDISRLEKDLQKVNVP